MRIKLNKEEKNMSLVGTEVKPFKAQAFHNGKFIEVTEENFKGKWSVVCFYPADFTFVCPTELEDLQNNYEELKKLGAEVYSVSTDTHYTHKAWHDSSEAIRKLTYIMIGDPSHTLCRNFDVLIEADGLQIVEPSSSIRMVSSSL
jgi:peroxiredoxin (alkyl hydroperoxide reductase subunit C)